MNECIVFIIKQHFKYMYNIHPLRQLLGNCKYSCVRSFAFEKSEKKLLFYLALTLKSFKILIILIN